MSGSAPTPASSDPAFPKGHVAKALPGPVAASDTRRAAGPTLRPGLPTAYEAHDSHEERTHEHA